MADASRQHTRHVMITSVLGVSAVSLSQARYGLQDASEQWKLSMLVSAKRLRA